MAGSCGNVHTFQPHEVADLKDRGLWEKTVEVFRYRAKRWPDANGLVIRVYEDGVYTDLMREGGK